MEEIAIESCSKCSTVLTAQDTFCSECGYPEKGTKEDKERYHYRIKLKMDVVEEAKKKLKHVKILLYFIAGINLCAGIYYIVGNNDFIEGIFSIIAAGIFLACVFWVNKQPLTGILAAFVFWIVLQLLVVFEDPALLANGIILKAVFIGIFIKGISSAKDVNTYTAQLKDMKAI